MCSQGALTIFHELISVFTGKQQVSTHNIHIFSSNLKLTATEKSPSITEGSYWAGILMEILKLSF